MTDGGERPEGTEAQAPDSLDRTSAADAWRSAIRVAGALSMQIRAAADADAPVPPEQHVYDLIVPTFNAPETLTACLDSLIAHTDSRHLVHVIDDASTDPRVDPILRRYAARHPHIRYYRLPSNLGFPGAVNAALTSTSRDVVLVNADTEVPAGWLARMDRCRSSDPAIHAVSPLSNNATICSVPGFNQNNRLPAGLTVADMDRLVRRTSLRRYPRVPTAVGFCMLMTRRAIDDVGPFDMAFGRGYGEEVDWCQRAWQRGYASVICDDVFVYHHGEMSFSNVPERRSLQHANARLVSRRWPGYLPAVRAYCAANPLRCQQQRLHEALRPASGDRIRVLHVTHSFGQPAGTELFTRLVIDGMQDRAISTVLFPGGLSANLDAAVELEGRGLLEGGLLKVTVNAVPFGADHTIRGVSTSLRSDLAERFFADVVAGSGAQVVQFNHLANLGSLSLPLVARALGAKVVIVLHDYFLLCPDWNLLHADGRACGEPKAASDNIRCIDCLGRRTQSQAGRPPLAVGDFLARRNALCRAALEEADALVAPSEFVRAQFARAWGESLGERIRVVPHGTSAHPFDATHEAGPTLRVAFLGNAGALKGIGTFLEAARRLRGRPVRFRILGGLPPDIAIAADDNVEVTGSYVQRELGRLLQDVDVAYIGSIVHESYCFTLDEALRAGVPVIASAVGAIPERLCDGVTGTLVPPHDAAALVAAIERLEGDRVLLASMRRSVAGLRLRTIKEVVADYLRIYEGLVSDRGVPSDFLRVMRASPPAAPSSPLSLEAFAAATARSVTLPLVPQAVPGTATAQAKRKGR